MTGSRPFMNFPIASTNLAPARQEIPSTDEASLTQSKETGALTPSPHLKNVSIAKGDSLEIKPWAHFVAGGYAT